MRVEDAILIATIVIAVYAAITSLDSIGDTKAGIAVRALGHTVVALLWVILALTTYHKVVLGFIEYASR